MAMVAEVFPVVASLHFWGGEKRRPEIRPHSLAISIDNPCWDHEFNKIPFMMRTFVWSDDQNKLPLKVCNGRNRSNCEINVNIVGTRHRQNSAMSN